MASNRRLVALLLICIYTNCHISAVEPAETTVVTSDPAELSSTVEATVTADPPEASSSLPADSTITVQPPVSSSEPEGHGSTTSAPDGASSSAVDDSTTPTQPENDGTPTTSGVDEGTTVDPTTPEDAGSSTAAPGVTAADETTGPTDGTTSVPGEGSSPTTPDNQGATTSSPGEEPTGAAVTGTSVDATTPETSDPAEETSTGEIGTGTTVAGTSEPAVGTTPEDSATGGTTAPDEATPTTGEPGTATTGHGATPTQPAPEDGTSPTEEGTTAERTTPGEVTEPTGNPDETTTGSDVTEPTAGETTPVDEGTTGVSTEGTPGTPAVGSTKGPEETTTGSDVTEPTVPDETTPDDEATTKGPENATTPEYVVTTVTTTPEPTTVRTPPPPIRGPPPATPPEWSNAPFVVPLSIMIMLEWNPDLNNPNSPLFITIQADFVAQISIQFAGSPGTFMGVRVTGFRSSNANNDKRKKRAAAESGNTLIDFDLDYGSEDIIAAGDGQVDLTNDIFKFAGNQMILLGYNGTIATYDVNEDYIEENTINQLNSSRVDTLATASDPCENLGANLCPTTCNPQCDFGTSATVSCVSVCTRDGQICSEQPENTHVCVCNTGFVAFGDGCADEIVVIAVASTVGGVIIIALLVATIALGCKNKSVKKKYKDAENEQLIERAYDVNDIPRDIPGEAVNQGFTTMNPTFDSYGGTQGPMEEQHRAADNKYTTGFKEDNRDSVLGDESPEDGRSDFDQDVAPDYAIQEPSGAPYRPHMNRRPMVQGPQQDTLDMESIHIENTAAYRNFQPQLHRINPDTDIFNHTPLRINLRSSNRYGQGYMYDA